MGGFLKYYLRSVCTIVVAVDPSPDTPDEDIARRTQSGDVDAFGILVDRYEKKLKRYGTKFLARPEDIEDIVQDVFTRAYASIQSFDSSLRFSPWLYRIAHNAFVNALRKGKYRPYLVDFDTLVAHPVYEDPAEAARDRADIKALIDRGIETLSPKYREVLLLHYYEELSYKDIADVLRVPVGTVGVRLKRAKDALKHALADTHGH